MNFQHQSSPRRVHRAVLVCLGFGALLAASFAGQQLAVGPIKGSRTTEFYPAPNQNQLKSLLTSSNVAISQNLSVAKLTVVRLETFRVTGERELVVEAESCTFDSAARMLNSDGAIKVQAAGGKLLVEGTGFSWQGTNSVITISNQSHIVLKRAEATTQQKP